MELFDILKEKVIGKEVKIVFPEGNEERILEATKRLQSEGLLHPILIGDSQKIKVKLSEMEIDASSVEVIDPSVYERMDEMVQALVERRNGKIDEEKAKHLLQDVNYFGVMLVYLGLADGMVSGAVHSTADTVRPALQIIKTKPDVSRTSGAFIMVKGEEKYVFSDCAINISPSSQELAEIAINSAETAKIFGIDPKIAMLSFSTMGSGHGPEVDKVRNAVDFVKEAAPNLLVDGELQFDAAFVQNVGALKAPDSSVAGNATVFVFPDLQSGNIGYKIAQRMGEFEAVGPILQGLNKPVNDLSRGASIEDVYKLAIITASQAL